VPFFILVVIVGAFFLINLVLAVIGQSLDQTDADELEQSNKSKQSMAFSLLRKAKNLSPEEREKFLAKLT
jgi:preprotein translocase subunit SecG